MLDHRGKEGASGRSTELEIGDAVETDDRHSRYLDLTDRRVHGLMIPLVDKGFQSPEINVKRLVSLPLALVSLKIGEKLIPLVFAIGGKIVEELGGETAPH